MPLSEDEQRILQDIERNFYEQDPSFARSVGRPGLYRHASRNCKFAAVGIFIGLLIVLGTFTRYPIIAFLGFILMATCGGVFAQNIRRIGRAGLLDVAESDQAHQAASSLDEFRSRFKNRFRRQR